MSTIVALTLRTIKENKRRTWMTILTMVLSVSMMTAVLCGSWSVVRFLQKKEQVYSGDYAYSMDLESKEQAESLMNGKNVEDVALLHFAGSSFYGEATNQTLLAVAEVNAAFFEHFSLKANLLEGRFPVDETELILTREYIRDNDLRVTIGDTIQLSLGARVWDEIDAELYGKVNYLGERESFHVQKEKTYTIVGIVSEMKDSKVACEFNAYSGISDSASGITAYVTSSQLSKSVYEEAKENAKAVNGQGEQFHDDLLMYYGITKGKGAIKMIAMVLVVVILLMVACATMISNVLSISLQERIRQLGILASVGATKKQKRQSVQIEACMLGIAGIPAGILLGLGFTLLILLFIRHSFAATFSLGEVNLKLSFHWMVLLLDIIAGTGALVLACRKPGKMASSLQVVDTLKQTSIYKADQKQTGHGRMLSLFFGVYGALAGKNIYRNPKRFRAITVSIFLAVVLGLSLYSFSDFMLLQTSMDMKEDGSSYTDVFVAVCYKDMQKAVQCISNQGISADISYRISRYMDAQMDASKRNDHMRGYFINDTLAELYVVGMDEEHFRMLCKENQLDPSAYEGESNRGILFNCAVGNYGASSSRVVIGSPLKLESGAQISLEIDDEEEKVQNVIAWDVVNESNAAVQSRFVRNLPVLILPFSSFQWLIEEDTYIELAIQTEQHEVATKALADAGFFQVVDEAKITENARQIFVLLKMTVCIFTAFMTLIIGLNVCNTISNTIHMRENEFAVLRSVGMTTTGLKKMLLLEAALYGCKSLVLALPVSFALHCIMYRMLSRETPFVFYVNWGAYGIVVLAVALVVTVAMCFAMSQIEQEDIVAVLKKGSI